MKRQLVPIAIAFITFFISNSSVAESEPAVTTKNAPASSCGLSLSAVPSGGAFRPGSSYDVLIRLSNLTSTGISLWAHPWLFNLKLFNSSGNVARSGVVPEYDSAISVDMSDTIGTNGTTGVPAYGSLDYHINLGDRYTKMMAGTYKFGATVKIEEIRAVGTGLAIFHTDCVLVDPKPSIVVQ